MNQAVYASLPRPIVVLGITMAVCCSLVLFWFDPAQNHFYPVCLFHRVTGLLCPGCGSLRALHQLLHGRLGAAFRFNPMLIAALPLVVALVFRFAARESRCEPGRPLISGRWFWVLGFITLVVSIWRNLPGAPTAILPP